MKVNTKFGGALAVQEMATIVPPSTNDMDCLWINTRMFNILVSKGIFNLDPSSVDYKYMHFLSSGTIFVIPDELLAGGIRRVWCSSYDCALDVINMFPSEVLPSAYSYSTSNTFITSLDEFLEWLNGDSFTKRTPTDAHKAPGRSQDFRLTNMLSAHDKSHKNTPNYDRQAFIDDRLKQFYFDGSLYHVLGTLRLTTTNFPINIHALPGPGNKFRTRLFFDSARLRAIEIPKAICTFEGCVTFNCSNLKAIKFEAPLFLNNLSFSGAKSLEYVIFPQGSIVKDLTVTNELHASTINYMLVPKSMSNSKLYSTLNTLSETTLNKHGNLKFEDLVPLKQPIAP